MKHYGLRIVPIVNQIIGDEVVGTQHVIHAVEFDRDLVLVLQVGRIVRVNVCTPPSLVKPVTSYQFSDAMAPSFMYTAHLTSEGKLARNDCDSCAGVDVP